MHIKKHKKRKIGILRPKTGKKEEKWKMFFYAKKEVKKGS